MIRQLIIAIIACCTGLCAGAQAMYVNSARVTPQAQADTMPHLSVSDSLLLAHEYDIDEIFNIPVTLPDVFFMPAIYDTYHVFTPLSVGEQVHSDNEAMRWWEDYDVLNRQMLAMQHNLFYNHPEHVRYNLSMLPVAPPQYQAVIDPSDLSVSIKEVVNQTTAPTIEAEKVKRRHWINTFNASLQFSQAYVSPNWYQGGNNNLNALGQIYYNVKLNEVFHPNLLFETTMQYKLGMNNAPDDSIHAYNISDDLFQINTTFGVKAAHRWYYSLTGQFKTQLLNSYKSNTHSLKSSFLSPGELTAGLGMTYAYKNKDKTFTFDASLAPVSYNLKTCINTRMNPENYGIEVGHKTVSHFGSTGELKLSWRMARNILLTSRVFAFSDYESFQADWENTLAFEINRFLTTQIYCHARYDTRTPYDPDEEKWKKLQIKEIFSIGFAYKFSSL
ncbi:MAG: DUF3078 domain-containing protein [Muribaculaceae bacterium]